MLKDAYKYIGYYEIAFKLDFRSEDDEFDVCY